MSGIGSKGLWKSAYLIAGQQQLQSSNLAIQVGDIAFEHIFQPYMVDFALNARFIAGFTQLAIDDGDKDGTSFNGVGEGSIELLGGLGLGLDLQPPCCNVFEGVPNRSKLDSSELNVESNATIAVSDFI